MMKAAVIYEPGGPEVLKLETIPVPQPKDHEVLIRIKAFGLNRSELFTRQGHSPGVEFPRVLGIEACGLVEAAPGGQFKKNQIVATAMGGMVRTFLIDSFTNVARAMSADTNVACRVAYLTAVTPSSPVCRLLMSRPWRRSWTGRLLVLYRRCSRPHMGPSSRPCAFSEANGSWCVGGRRRSDSPPRRLLRTMAASLLAAPADGARRSRRPCIPVASTKFWWMMGTSRHRSKTPNTTKWWNWLARYVPSDGKDRSANAGR